MREFLKHDTKISNYNHSIVVCDAPFLAGDLPSLTAPSAREEEAIGQMKGMSLSASQAQGSEQLWKLPRP